MPNEDAETTEERQAERARALRQRIAGKDDGPLSPREKTDKAAADAARAAKT